MLTFFSTRSAYLTLLSCLVGALLFSACSSSNPYTKQYQDHRDAQITLDEASIQKFLADSGITNYTRQESGLFVQPLSEGTGDVLQAGQRVEIQYIGRYLNDGQLGVIFDSSYDNRTPCQCIQGVVGAGGGFTPGFAEALALMKLGTRQRAFVPSRLGYGSSLSGDQPSAVGDDRVLVFDMVVTRIVQ